jgi:hypothetical protein
MQNRNRSQVQHRYAHQSSNSPSPADTLHLALEGEVVDSNRHCNVFVPIQVRKHKVPSIDRNNQIILVERAKHVVHKCDELSRRGSNDAVVVDGRAAEECEDRENGAVCDDGGDSRCACEVVDDGYGDFGKDGLAVGECSWGSKGGDSEEGEGGEGGLHCGNWWVVVIRIIDY